MTGPTGLGNLPGGDPFEESLLLTRSGSSLLLHKDRETQHSSGKRLLLNPNAETFSSLNSL